MFDPERAVEAWRSRLERTGSFREVDLEELEGHLRDEADALVEQGRSPEEAFAGASEKMGEPEKLADEFARAAPHVAWRAPLGWLGWGYLATMVGLSILFVAQGGATLLGGALHLPSAARVALVWLVTLGGPALVLPLLVLAAARAGRRAAPWRIPWVVRVGGLVLAGAIVLGERLSWMAVRHVDPAVVRARWMSFFVLACAGPVLVLAATLLARRRALRAGDANAPAAWFLLGCVFELAGRCFQQLVQSSAMFAGAAARAEDLGVLLWVTTLAAPLVWLGVGLVLQRAVPSPRAFMRSRAADVTAAAAWAVTALWLAGSDRITLAAMRRADLGQAWTSAFLAGLVVAAASPVLVGAAILFLRDGRASLRDAVRG